MATAAPALAANWRVQQKLEEQANARAAQTPESKPPTKKHGKHKGK